MPSDDIFEGVGSDYVPSIEVQSPESEDMEESPRDNERQSYFSEHYGPAPPTQDVGQVGQGWEHQVCTVLCFRKSPVLGQS